jgi:hypothetical protein
VLLLLALAFVGAARATPRCGGPLPRAPSGLPAPLALTTGCGRFQIGRSGRISRRAPARRPRGVASYADGSWYRLDRGHLVIGRWDRRLWRSRRRFAKAYEVGVVTAGRQTVAFTYGRASRLFVAALGSAEREVARGELPLGWARADALFTRAGRGGELRLRHANGDLARTLARRVVGYTFDRVNGEVDFVENGDVLRTDGSGTVRMGRLTRLRLSARPELDPLGRLLALRDRRRLVVLRRDGSVFAATRLPAAPKRADGVSSAFVAAPDGRSVAFAATRGNSAYGSRGIETTYLLRAGSRSSEAIHRVRLRFAVCARGAALAWHGSWLLYSSSEGRIVVLDTRDGRTALDLSSVVPRLPGTRGGEGAANVQVTWSASRLPS